MDFDICSYFVVLFIIMLLFAYQVDRWTGNQRKINDSLELRVSELEALIKSKKDK